MAKDILTVEIKRIPLEVENSGLGGMELAELAAQVETYMMQLQADGEIDTLKQALYAALHFASQAYLKSQNEGGKRQEELSRLDELILKLKVAQEK
ncbi:MAG: hypothetical protein IJ876_02955 [Elusimicrobiaceae bacterium]|nr:hypothetical protein [Elusimicrobiaceae bacterium]